MGDLQSWKKYKVTLWDTKRKLFDDKIHEIASSNKRLWDLINWVKKKSLPAIKSILFENYLCNILLDL